MPRGALPLNLALCVKVWSISFFYTKSLVIVGWFFIELTVILVPENVIRSHLGF